MQQSETNKNIFNIMLIWMIICYEYKWTQYIYRIHIYKYIYADVKNPKSQKIHLQEYTIWIYNLYIFNAKINILETCIQMQKKSEAVGNTIITWL